MDSMVCSLVDVDELDHCSVQWSRAVAISQHALRAALHGYTL